MTVKEWLGENNKLGIDIWERKYRRNGETFDQWIGRVSGGNQNIARMIIEKKFLFGGRILSNRGMSDTGKKVTYSNCYVIEPPEDNIESIFDRASKLARTYSYGGGCGLDLSKLAPRGAKVNNTADATSGSVSFMDLYSLVTGLIGQNGRRGALMLSISCDHPDLEEFIGIKSDLNKVTKANISIRMTDEFMTAVKNKEMFTLKFSRPETGETIVKEVNAYEIFKRICEMNNDYAEPGMLFWDRIESYSLLSNDPNFKYAGVNPCAEEPLPAGGSCLLGSINLSAFVDPNGIFHFEELHEAVHYAVIALNEVLDEGLPLHPLKEQRESVRDWRQIGLGIFGLADCLIQMGITYGSKKAIMLSNQIGFAIADEAIHTSAMLAKEYGPYPMYNAPAVMSSDFFQNNVSPASLEAVKQFGLRNSQLLTIAPTGTLSSMLGVSGGIEPIFANFYTRKTESLHGHDEYYKVYTPIVERYMKVHDLTDDSELPEYFVTAQTIHYMNRVEMQAAWQNHIDASISSTVNVPNNFTTEDVGNLYMQAWAHGLKGITMFRDGCKRAGILTTDVPKKSDAEESTEELPRGYIIDASDDLVGKKRKLITGCGSLHCEAFFDPATGDLMETFLSKGSTGGCNNSLIGLSRMISIAARAGCRIETIVDQLNSCGSCPSYAVRRATKHDTSKGSCCPMAVGNALLDMWNEMQNDIKCNDEEIVRSEKSEATDKKQGKAFAPAQTLCPECGEPLVYEGGCVSCKSCGWSKCN